METGRHYEWTRLLGVVFVLIAVWAVTNPDWPVSRVQEAPPAPARSHAWPHAVAPVGEHALPLPAFEWRWDGPPTPWELVLLDESYAELAAIPVGAVLTWHPTPEMAAKLAPGRHYHWFVRATVDGKAIKSTAVALHVKA
jgi:hypothetical protein